jgi:EmrB/QacA subfamily drug resistance transporter
MNVASKTQIYPERSKVLAGLVLAMGLAAMDTTIVATAVPSIVRNLGGFSLFTWVFSAYLLTQAVTVPIYGKLADLHGRKPVLLVGAVIFLVGSALCGMSWSMPTLIAFRAVQGIGAGAVQPIVTTAVGDMYTIEERARVQGWLSSVWGISAIVGPAVGGFFAEYASWRWIFYVNVPLGAVALFMVGTYLHENVERKRHSIDYAGAVLLATAVGLLMLGLLEGGTGWAWLSALSLLTFVASAVALVAFVWQERRAAEPIVPPWVFGRRLLITANLATASLGLLIMGLSTFLPTYAQDVLGANAIVAGFALAVMSIGWPLASTFSGTFYLRIGFRNTALIGAVSCLASGIFFSALSVSAPVSLVALGSLIMGVGFGFLSTSLIVGLQAVVDWDRRGTVTGANMFSRQLGQTVGAAIFGTVANAALTRWLEHAPSSEAGPVPKTVDAASRFLGSNGSHLDTATEHYVRHGLYLAVHHVFLGLIIVSALTVVVLILTPRHFEKPRF